MNTYEQSRRALICELWGLGDLILALAAVHTLRRAGWEVAVTAKTSWQPVADWVTPPLEWIPLDAPWTAFRGKYRLHRWPWPALRASLAHMRAARFDAALSARREPRDALLMRLAGMPRTVGIAAFGSQLWGLSDSITPHPDHHRVEDWWKLCEALSPGCEKKPPIVNRPTMPQAHRLTFALHCGAGHPMRRWPLDYVRAILPDLREAFGGVVDFRLLPDADGYGRELADIPGVSVVETPTLDALRLELAACHGLLGNDSGPGHLAAAMGVPVFTLFGSQRPEWFRPWGETHAFAKLEPAPSPPRFDSGGETERLCLTRLTPDHVRSSLRKWAATVAAVAARP